MECKAGLGMALALGVSVLGAVPGVAWASRNAPWAVVDMVQAPVWVERGDKRLVAIPGLALQNRDRLITGAGARVAVQLSEGSVVKLGEQTTVALNALGEREGGVFTAALDVSSGAFRLTTEAVPEAAHHRAINVRAGSVTAGIRGTDLWGRADGERDAICLQEGRIVVSHPAGEAVELNEPLQCYGAAKGGAPGPVFAVERKDFGLAALAVERQDGPGSLQRGGRWSVRLAVAGSEADALSLYDQALAAGFAPRIRPLRGSGGYRYELRIGQIADQREAQRLAERLSQALNLAGPAVVRP